PSLSVIFSLSLHDALPILLFSIMLIVMMYLALSVFVTYMRDRADLRTSIWGGEKYTARMTQMVNTFVTMEWFDPYNPQHLARIRSEEHTSELQSRGHLVCR